MDETKTMLNAPGSVGPERKVSYETETPMTPGDYHEFEGSQSKQYETFSKREAALSEALGNKDTVKG